MDSMQLYNELDNRMRLLDQAVKELRSRGNELAEAEREYKVALAKAILEERSKGTPVTIMGDLCRGRADIATLRFQRDCAKVLYRSALEYIQTVKLELKLLENQICREWGQAKNMV